MRHLVAAWAVGCAAACAAQGPAVVPSGAPAKVAAPAPTARQVELRNPAFEAEPRADSLRCAPAWDCTVHGNPEAYRFHLEPGGSAAGRRTLCVLRVRDEPWALVTQAFDGVAFRGQRVRMSLSVRMEGVTGPGAGPWLLSQGGHAHGQTLVTGTGSWQRVEVELQVPRDSTSLVVGATLEGPGKACFDDMRLEIMPG